MDLQKARETRRNTPGKQDEGTEGPLDTYGSSGHSNEFGQNDKNAHRKPAPTNNTNKRPQHKYPRRISPTPAARPSGAQPPSSKAMGIPRALDLSARDQKLLLVAKRHPPVTKRTLSELDLPCIMSNINLRMDANFDRDLHFKPDLDGDKGKRKRKEAADYWGALAAEIAIYNFNAACGTSVAAGETDGEQEFDPRLPVMFETLQDILKTLVPERDHASVVQNLEVSLLMQQIRRGVLDMVGVASWLATLLKTHCAPMRDEWADRMVKQISLALESQDALGVVNGLQTLFAILEAMKLVWHIARLFLENVTDKECRMWQITRSAHFEHSLSKILFPSYRSTS